MAGKFLNLTFHGANALTGEDLRFKEAAIQSALVSGDAMDETGPSTFLSQHPELMATGRKSDGMEIVSRNGFDVVTMARIGYPAWFRPAYEPVRKSVFGQWLGEVLKIPIEVLVLGGHHSNSYVWGAQLEDRDSAGNLHNREEFCALHPEIEANSGKPVLSVLSAVKPSRTIEGLTREGPFDVSATFAQCKLLIVYGCNGATSDIVRWRNCIAKAAGKPPFILGWYGVHAFPRDRRKQFLSEKFWPALKTAATNIGANNLDFLHDSQHTGLVLETWFSSVAMAFPETKPLKEDQSHLVFSPKTSKGKRGPRGAGAIDPKGFIYRSTDLNGNFKQVEEVQL